MDATNHNELLLLFSPLKSVYSLFVVPQSVIVLSLLAKKKKNLLTVDDQRCKSRGFTQGALGCHSVLAGIARRAAEVTEWLVSG